MNTLILRYPASWWGNMWREALPSGNGKIGAAVYGGVHQETILLNHSELWYGTQRADLPDVSHTLADVRRLMDDKQYAEANELLSQTLKEKGYQANVGAVLPFADLKLTMPCRQGFTQYRRCLNMATGEVTVQWLDGETAFARRLFVSRADDVVVYEIETSQEKIHAELTISLHDHGDSHHGHLDDAVMENHCSRDELLNTLGVRADGEYLYYAVRNDDGTDFGAVLRVLATEGRIETDGETLCIQNAGRVLILAKLFVKGERQLQWQALRRELETVPTDYVTLLDAHRPLHQDLFESATIDISDGEDLRSNEELLLEAYEGHPSNSLIQKMWAYGRYLFVSATRQDGLPCALYGLWCGNYNPMWCQNVANENIEMIYWHAAVGGLCELMRPVFTYYDSLREDSKENARKLFGCRGIVIHGYTSPGMGLASVNVPVIMNWTSAAGWIGKFYFDYYRYTGDRDFLIQTALPFLREVALFYEDFQAIGDDGYWMFYPSVSPENSPGNYVPEHYGALTHPLPTTINATMDFAIAKELLSNLIEGSRTAGVYEEDIERWEALAQRIPPYQTNRDGAVREWMHPDFEDNYHHRHIAHVYPIFPGHEIHPDNRPELFQAFKIAVEKRLMIGLGDQSNWSLVHLACIYARLEDGDRALECLELLTRSCVSNNFYTLANDWRNMGICIPFKIAPFQIDGNIGLTNAVQEMLLYVSPELIKILPACPGKWRQGRVERLRFCTGRISFTWDWEQGQFQATLTAERDTDVTLKLPVQLEEYRWQETGRDAQVLSRAAQGREIRLAAGCQLKISAIQL